MNTDKRDGRPQLAEDSMLVASGRQTSADLGGAAALLNLDTKTYYTVEGTALRIWELLREPTPLSGLVARLVERYDVDPERCRREVRAFVETLLDHGLVEIRP